MWWWFMLAAGAAEPVTPWEALQPWRTYVVVEHVDRPRHWFVVPEVPGVGQRCEASIIPGESALTHCGAATIVDGEHRAVPGRLGKVARSVLAALHEATNTGPGALKRAGFAYLGERRRVSLRQVVVLEAAEEGRSARTRTLTRSWDVDVGTGEVRDTLGSSQPTIMPLCTEGRHTGCDDGARLAGWTPPPGWDGMVVDHDVDDSAVLTPLRALVRSVGMGVHAGTWTPADPRPLADGVLPDDLEAGLAVRLNVVAQHGGRALNGFLAVHVPLDAAAFGPTAMTLPLEGAPVAVELGLDLPGGSLVLRLRPEGARYVEREAPVQCAFTLEGDRAALARPCDVAWGGRWVSWTAPGGGTRVMVQLDDELVPVLTPVPEVALRREVR